jgi:hypothetical protein
MAAAKHEDAGRNGNSHPANFPASPQGRLTDTEGEAYCASATVGDLEGPPGTSGMTPEQEVQLRHMYDGALAQLGVVEPEYGQPLLEDLRLQVQYPREFVAYLDEWVEQGRGKARRLLRSVICHSQDISAVLDAVDRGGYADDPRVTTLHVKDG